MTGIQWLLLLMISLVAAFWALSAIWVSRAHSPGQAISRAARSTAVPALGVSIAALILQRDQAWQWLVVSAAATILALVAERRVRVRASSTSSGALDGDGE